MKIGMNMLLWTSHLTDAHAGILRQLKNWGYDGVQVPIFEGDEAHYRHLARLLDDLGLERTGLTLLPERDMHILSEDPAHRAKGLAHLKWAIDCSVALGATQLGGPVHQTLGFFTGAPPTEIEVGRAIECHRALGDHAQAAGVPIAIEALNRFECYFVNTMADLGAYVDRVGHPFISGMYDTFHANIEEKSVSACIRPSARWIKHVHISENDRGTPGKGHIDWPAVFRELKASGYDGWLTIEAFGRALPQLAAATRVWRDFFPHADEVWQEGFHLIRDGWRAA
jgi:D-psicose/D-tagatose/L-ribulose 3-epimerase